MGFIVTANTDAGARKGVNQDSLLVKHGVCPQGEILLAVICDGMGGLAKGELASAMGIRAASRWFEEELPYELGRLSLQALGGKLSRKLQVLNQRLQEYGKLEGITLGTTFTGLLFVKDRYVIIHVGDTRVYHIGSRMRQLTEDQTYVAREVQRGAMTREQARTDRWRNMLLQCVGASDVLRPEVLSGRREKGVYMLCSDGFRHELREDEMYEFLNPARLPNKEAMDSCARYLTEQVKGRRERDNISVILVKTD